MRRSYHRRGAENLNGDARELFDRGQARRDLGDAVVPERPHALLHRGSLELLAARLLRGERLERLAHRQELEDPDPALVTGLVASRAPALAVEDHPVRLRRDVRRDARLDELLDRRRIHLAAVRAELAPEALG